MDSGTLIVSIITVSICILPFVLVAVNTKRKEVRLLNTLNKMALEHNSKISKHEFCSDFVMGLDTDSKYLFFYRKSDKFEISKSINLMEYKTTNAIKHVTNIKTNGGDQKIIDKIGLLFVPLNSKIPEVLLELYDSNQSHQLSDELQFTEEWSRRINSVMKTSGVSKPIKQLVYA